MTKSGRKTYLKRSHRDVWCNPVTLDLYSRVKQFEISVIVIDLFRDKCRNNILKPAMIASF
jgi:hypothetical protein